MYTYIYIYIYINESVYFMQQVTYFILNGIQVTALFYQQHVLWWHKPDVTHMAAIIYIICAKLKFSVHAGYVTWVKIYFIVKIYGYVSYIFTSSPMTWNLRNMTA
jgi:hypothetical protein